MQRQWLPVTSIHENADRPSSVSNTSKSIQYHNISQQTDAGLPPLVTARSDYEHLLGKRPRTQRPDLSTTMHTSIEPPSGGMTVHFTRRLSSGAASSGKDMAGTGARRDTQQDPPRECYSSNHRLTPTHAADAGALNYDQPFFDDLNASAPSQTCLQPSPYPQNYRMSHLPHANLPRLHQYDLQHDNHQLGLTNSMPEITIRTPLDGHNISASYPFTSPYLPNSDLSSPLYYRRNNTIKEACCEDTFDYDVLSSNVQNLDQFTPPTIHDPNNSICPRSDAFFPQYTALYTSHSNNTVNYFSDNDEMDDNLLCRSSRLLSHTNAEFTPGSYNYEYTYSIPSSHTLQHGSAHAQTLHQTSQVLPAGYADSEQPSSHGSNVGRQRPRSTKRRSLDRPGEREEVAEKRRNRTVCWYHHKKKRKVQYPSLKPSRVLTTIVSPPIPGGTLPTFVSAMAQQR